MVHRPASVNLRPGECLDRLMQGRLKLIQSKDGYRFSVDAILLSQFVTVKPNDLVVDLGTGCGVILLLLLATRPIGHAIGVDIQEELVDQAARNAVLNGFEHRMDVLLGDIGHPPFAKKSADLVICNPPYRAVKRGRLNPDPRKAIARHELLASLEDILSSARLLLRTKGRLALIYPSERLMEVLVGARRAQLEPKRIQIIYPDLRANAKLALVEAWLGAKPGLTIEPPIIGQGDLPP